MGETAFYRTWQVARGEGRDSARVFHSSTLFVFSFLFPSKQAALWRDEGSKRLVVAFRGTSDPGDLVTDVNLIQTPWTKRKDPKENKETSTKSDLPMVHTGFREALDSVSSP